MAPFVIQESEFVTTPSGRPGSAGGSHALTQKRNNMGAAPFSRTRAQRRGSGNSQADQRRPHFMWDQHGRQWSCSVEIHSGMPTGLITNDFNAPWLPDQNALVVNPNDTSELWIDYGLMWRERMQALGAYHKLAVALCVDKGWPVPTKGAYSNDIRRAINEPPKPLQPVKAAAQENPWILGFSDVVDARLYEYVVPIEDRDADLDDGEDYSPDGFADRWPPRQTRRTDEEMRQARAESTVLSGRAATVAFAPPANAVEEMEEDGVGDYADELDVDEGAYDDDGEDGDGDDDALGVQGTDTPSDADAEEESPLALLEEAIEETPPRSAGARSSPRRPRWSRGRPLASPAPPCDPRASGRRASVRRLGAWSPSAPGRPR
jgi:hypothetical protein